MTKRKGRVDQSSKVLSTLSVGTKVLVQDMKSKRWDINAVVTQVRKNNRSYTIKTENGKFYLRNRKFLRPVDQQPRETVEAGPQLILKSPSSESVKSPRRSTRLKFGPDVKSR